MNICLSCEGVTATAAQRCGHCGAYLLPLDSVHYPARRGEADAGNPLLGSVVAGKYRLEGVLGRGGLGTVFQAEHIGSLMKVAVKLLHPRFSERAEYRRALLPEARRAATVTNERCARLLDVGETSEGGTYLAMELVDGDTLDTLVKRGPLAPSHAVDILVQIAEALVAIHAAGLVHCDLAPRNVMVSTRGNALVAKVLDFGIARSVSMTSSERVEDGEFVGFANPAFSAPEHLAGGEVDPRADLYSLGALAWFLLTGKAPIDGRDSARAARAAVAGDLEPWPGVTGVPRRLQQLISRCLALDPAERPVSAAAVVRELNVIRGARRPTLARAAVTGLAVAVVLAVAAFFETTDPLLRSVAGSPVELRDSLPPFPEHLTSGQLETLEFYFGGFSADQLQYEVARDGAVLQRRSLSPEVDSEGGTLTLAIAQREWRAAVDFLLESSGADPVDLSFVVPGRGPLGSIRIRLDDEPPRLEARLTEPTARVLTSETEVVWSADDAIGLDEVKAVVAFDSGEQFEVPLPGTDGTQPLGLDLRASIPDVGPRRGGVIRVEASDFAGNERELPVHTFDSCDVRAPDVVAVTGPAGEDYVPSIGNTAHLRVQLSAAEAGCEVVIFDLEGREVARKAVGAGVFLDVEIPITGVETPFVSDFYEFVVRDAVGNRSADQFECQIRDRNLRLRFLGDPATITTRGEELVIGLGGGVATLHCSKSFRVAGLAVVSGVGGELAGEAVSFETVQAGTTTVSFAPLEAGRYRLDIELEEESDGSQTPPVSESVPLRVLPEVIEVRVAAPTSRFLPGLTAAGVLAETDGAYREGAGWVIDPELVPYVRGSLWVGFGAETLVPLALPAPSSPSEGLLPEFFPLPGHNVLAVSLEDVLGRAVRVLIGDVAPPQRVTQGTTVDVIADFYWHDQPPELIGEELLVEHNQVARLRLRLPLPYEDDERDDLVLGIAQSEIPASSVVCEDDASSIATFELPFPVWSVAAQIADKPPGAYAEQLPLEVSVYVLTPVGRYEDVPLSLRTTRSTLRPVRLGDLDDLGKVPAELAALRLVPVLAPDGAFPEPMPATAPRALFRPQVAVAVRNIQDLLLQDREITCGEVRAIVASGLARIEERDNRDLIHADDPLGERRLRPDSMLPPQVAGAPADQPLTGANFFQAYSCCRLLGVVLFDDPAMFRLPMGCELELAAFGDAEVEAFNGPAAAGRPVRMSAFLAAAEQLAQGRCATAGETWIAGDFVVGAMGEKISGLDFGVREWVGDLPHISDNELLLSEWIRDHEGHLARVAEFASGATAPPPGLADSLRTFGMVRGLALGEIEGLLMASGLRLDPAKFDTVPASVPGVLRTEQLRRDGRDLLSTEADPRLSRIGFRLAGTAALIARLRGRE